MSRGIGKLQQTIVSALPQAKYAKNYRGWESWKSHYYGGRWVNYLGQIFSLPDDICDLRAVTHLLSSPGELMPNKFSANFSKAVAGLVRLGYLEAPDTITVQVPMYGYVRRRRKMTEPKDIEVNKGQIRFVRKTVPYRLRLKAARMS